MVTSILVKTIVFDRFLIFLFFAIFSIFWGWVSQVFGVESNVKYLVWKVITRTHMNTVFDYFARPY